MEGKNEFPALWRDEEAAALRRELGTMGSRMSEGLRAVSYAATDASQAVRRFTSAYSTNLTGEMNNRAKEKKIDKRRAANKAARKARRR